MKIFYLFILVCSIGTFTSCSDSVKDQIEQYIADNNLDAQSTGDGLYYVIEEPGNEEMPTVQSTVTVHYRGTLTNGKQFDSSYDRGAPSEFSLQGVIRGWQLGIPLFGKGGKGKLIIPPSLGYGSRDSGDIPGGSVLIFDIELIDFE